MANNDRNQLTDAAAAIALAYGAAALAAPRILGRAYGLSGNGETDALTRLYGSRTAGLGALALAAPDQDARKRVVQVAAAISAVDTLSAVVSGVTGATTARSSAMTAVTSAAVTALCLAAARS